MTRLIPLLAILAVAASQETAGDTTNASGGSSNCSTFKCRHGSKCKDGEADFAPYSNLKGVDFLGETSRDGQHCHCADAKHTGFQCDVPVVQCPDLTTYCFHGGTCAENKKGEYRCDCTTASDGFAAGKYCQHKSSSTCDATDDGLETDSWFCVNGGACNGKESDVSKKCNCKSGFEGPHCEFPTTAVEAKPESCDLNCKAGGQCVHGFKDHGDKHSHIDDLYFTKEKEKDGMHCICPEGYAGVRCEVKLDKCGGRYCYHGATCVTDYDDMGGGKKFCDCTTATDMLDAGALFAGKYCEAKSTKLCDSADGTLPHFCTNGGKCHRQAHMGCECDDPFTGPFCEYKNKEPKCKLKCKHGGQCRHGINNKFERGELAKKFDLGEAFDLGHIDFEHCSCPDGWYGIDCSMRVKKCGDGEHVCANDGECVATGTNKDGKVRWGCDCKGGTWAGQYCEHPANALCVLSGDPVEAGNKQAFCTNGGRCVDYVTPKDESHTGCDCPVGFHGRKCQYKNGEDIVEEVSTPKPEEKSPTKTPTVSGSSSSSSSSGDSSSSGKGGMKPAVVVVIIACVGGILVALAAARRVISRTLFRSGKEDVSDTPTLPSLSPAKSEFDEGEFKEVHMI